MAEMIIMTANGGIILNLEVQGFQGKSTCESKASSCVSKNVSMYCTYGQRLGTS